MDMYNAVMTTEPIFFLPENRTFLLKVRAKNSEQRMQFYQTRRKNSDKRPKKIRSMIKVVEKKEHFRIKSFFHSIPMDMKNTVLTTLPNNF